MEYSKTFESKNRITSATLYQRSFTETVANFCIRFVLGGNEVCTIGRRQLSIHSDSFIVLNKGTRCISNIDPNWPATIFSIEFDEAFLNDFAGKYFKESKSLLIEADDSAMLLRETIYPFKGALKTDILCLKSYLDNGVEDEDVINECLHRCLYNYYRVFNEEIAQKAKKLTFLHSGTRVEILRRLNLAKEYLYANYDKNINLESLANYACLSVNHLLRTFKLAYNQSPHQFLIQLRLQRAQLLLTKTEYPVYEIVNMVGFKCTSSFIRLFRTKYKTTPLKYRNVIAA